MQSTKLPEEKIARPLIEIQAENRPQPPLPDDNPPLATPEKDALAVMRDDKISPAKAPSTLKELIALNTLAKEVSKAPIKIKKSLVQKKHNIRHPRCATVIARKIGVNRHIVFSPKRKQNVNKRTQYVLQKRMVVAFMKRTDNSVMLPSKKDVLAGGLKRYALNDTVKNLFQKFICENPNIRMSFATFAKQRPRYIKSIKWAARRQCLCVKHQNLALKLKALKIKTSPNVFIRDHTCAEIKAILERIADLKVKYSVWRSEEIPSSDGKIIRKLRISEDEVTRADFQEICEEEFAVFRDHVRRTTEQYTQIKKLKESLDPDSEVMVQMDYSENLQCVYQDEPSQVFYDRRLITLHPMLLYFKSNDKLEHKSFVGVSDVLNHSASTSLAFVKKLIPEIVKLKPAVTMIHYVTDSPANQYRNKYIIKLVADHAKLFPGIKATWEYLEAGHGKGPCDGLGGSVKKQAEIAVKRGRIIRSAADLCLWASDEPGNVTLLYIIPADVNYAERQLKNAAYVKGISLAHSVRPGRHNIFLRETSCFETCCRDQIGQHGWQETAVQVSSEENQGDVRHENNQNVNTDSRSGTFNTVLPASGANTELETPEPESVNVENQTRKSGRLCDKTVPVVTGNSSNAPCKEVPESNKETLQSDNSGEDSATPADSDMRFKIGDFVNIKFRRKYYVGQIIGIDAADSEYYINFMTKRKNGNYVFPKVREEMWMRPHEVLSIYKPD